VSVNPSVSWRVKIPPTAPANVTSKPSRIHVAPSETTISQCHELHGIRSKRAGTYDSIVSPSAILPVFRAKKRATQNANQEVARVATALRAVFSSASLKLRRPTGAWLQGTWSISPVLAENEFRNATEYDRANNCYVTNPFPPGRPKR
jgi:hypothetical protein